MDPSTGIERKRIKHYRYIDDGLDVRKKEVKLDIKRKKDRRQ